MLNLNQIKTLISNPWGGSMCIAFILAVFFYITGYIFEDTPLGQFANTLGWVANITTIVMLFVYITAPNRFSSHTHKE